MTEGPSYTVLLFHSVDDRDRLSLRGLGNVRPDIFGELCHFLRREFDIVDLHTLLGLISAKDARKGRFLSITFDDGPKSYASNAVSILGSMHLPSTCFLITDCIGDKTIYWRYLYNYCVNAGFGGDLASMVGAEYGVSLREEDVFSFTRSNYCRDKNMRIIESIFSHIVTEEEYRMKESGLFLSFEDIRRLKTDPLITFGIHTRTHPVMSRLSDEELNEEIAGSAAFYRGLISGGPLMFSVPFGRLYRDFDERTVFSALDLSVEAIFSAYGGLNERGRAGYNIRRIPVHEGLLEAGAANFIRSLRQTEVSKEYKAAEKKLDGALRLRSGSYPDRRSV